jgi:very-short-patch-repair endonuclease
MAAAETNAPTPASLLLKKLSRAAKLDAARSRLERDLRALRLPAPTREVEFHESRKWRFDLAYPKEKLAIEIEGLTSDGGRHQRIAGYSEDLVKYNAAVLKGWRVLRFTPAQVKSGYASRTIEIYLTE